MPPVAYHELVPDPDVIALVHRRIAPYIHRTPLVTSNTIDQLLGARVWFKCENLQKVGAFKSRGAVNAVFSLEDEDVVKGVCTHSSGNHAQALARAAALRGVPAYIVMPQNAPAVKVEAVKQYGGIITFCQPTLEARESTLMRIQNETGAAEVHPYNHPEVILGQATCAREIFEEIPEPPDFIMTPVGGGGLLSGTCLSTECWSPETKIIAAEPEGADDAYRSFKSGVLQPSVHPVTIADGLLTSLGSLTWPIIRKYADDIITASDAYIISALRLVLERMKMVVEPSAVLPLAVLLKCHEEEPVNRFRGKRIVVILSGGNIDVSHLPFKN
jgi:threonine dehydratase